MKKISIKGSQFAYEVMGTGFPTVVLETGLGAESSEWAQSNSPSRDQQLCFDMTGRVEGKATQDKSTAMPGPWLMS